MRTAIFSMLLLLALSLGDGPRLEAQGGDGAANQPRDLQDIVFASCVSLEFFGNCNLYAAEYLGYFAEEGINIKFEEAIGTVDAKMVSTGHAHFAYPSPGIILTSLEAGLEIIAVHANQPVNIFGFAYKKGTINDWADFRGKSIALGDASWKSIGAPIIKAAGLDPDKDVTWTTVGDARYQATVSSKTDTLLTWDVEYGYLLGLGFDLEYLDADEVLPQLSNSVIVSTRLAREDPDLVRRFSRAVAKAQYFTLKNPAAVADITLLKYPGIDVTFEGAVKAVEYQVESYFGSTGKEREETLEKIGYFRRERWETTVKAALDSGIISRPIPLERIYTNDFVNTDWSRERIEEDARNYVFSSEAYKKSKK
ncbi:MAG: ABC transporter substrate-binding protein [Deltaproteobacteria bacterium]|jgi:ABC-type nitrate/sulfonate/bicarbonate transport system substrate-binding protein|nr:ABC transporter substrate-binding protein [Deltaproteobacteria bacterium]